MIRFLLAASPFPLGNRIDAIISRLLPGDETVRRDALRGGVPVRPSAIL